MIVLALAAAVLDITYVGPKADDTVIVEAVRNASLQCGAESISKVRVAWVDVEPTDAAGRLALDERALDVMERSGIGRDRERHPASFEMIRAMLTTRTFVRVVYLTKPEGQACMEAWFAENKFTVLSPAQSLPAELRD